VFSLVIMTEPYASHDASEIEHVPKHMDLLMTGKDQSQASLSNSLAEEGPAMKVLELI